MELIYIWINRDKKNLFREKGVNFSPEYDFIMQPEQESEPEQKPGPEQEQTPGPGQEQTPEQEPEQDQKSAGRWVLSENAAWKRKGSVFHTDVIENVTAVVGENGSGKTTLLEYLSTLDCRPLRKGAYDVGYEELRERDTQNNLCVLVFQDNNRIKIYHNFKQGIVNQTAYEVIDMSDSEHSERYSNCLRNQTDFMNVTKIYVTNAGYTSKNGISKLGRLDSLALTPAGIATVASSFYNRLLHLGSFAYRDTPEHRWRELVKKSKTANDFQAICDVLYFHKLIESQKLSGYMGKVSTRIKLSCDPAYSILDKKLDEIMPTATHQVENRREPGNTTGTEPNGETDTEVGHNTDNIDITDNIVDIYRDLRDQTLATHRSFDTNEPLVIRELVIYFILEMVLVGNSFYPKDISTIERFVAWFDELDKQNLSEADYFTNAYEEIKQLKSLLQSAEAAPNVVPENDGAYDRSLVFDYESNADGYISFLKFIADRVASDHSMVLRYLKIENQGMSSGERALQNILSWINLVPQFHRFHSEMPERLKDNVLILFDEMDMYLHPKWQSDFVKYLTEEIDAQFEGYKVQLIFATHSPLCLSDIPRENTVYLKNVNGQIQIDRREEHKQTFGRDIYTLLDDAFFMRNVTMGSYAKKYINDIIDKIVDPDTGEPRPLPTADIEAIAEQIDYIGNPVLHTKLETMLQNCYEEKEEKLVYLKKQRDILNNQIALLENG